MPRNFSHANQARMTTVWQALPKPVQGRKDRGVRPACASVSAADAEQGTIISDEEWRTVLDLPFEIQD